jgi:hypothetical protein
MKTTLLALFAICILSSTAAFGQYAAYLDPQPHPVMFGSHELHASEGTLLPERNLYVRTAMVIAQGERPLWEFDHPAEEMPLGDVARMLKQEHATAKKAVKVLEKQGK